MRILALGLAFMVLAAVPLDAKQVKGSLFPASIDLKGLVLELQGVGDKSSLVVKKDFTAAFYLQHQVTVDYALSDAAKELDIIYSQRSKARPLVNKISKYIKANLSKEEYKEISSSVSAMRAYFVDAKKDDHLSVFYIVGVGTHFYFNNELKGIIEGPVFAKGFFSAWIGEVAMDQQLKTMLLGK